VITNHQGRRATEIFGGRRWRYRARRGGAKRRSAEGGGVWGGRRSPSSVWGSERKIFKNQRPCRMQGLPKFFGYPLLSQEKLRTKLRTSNFVETFIGSIGMKGHENVGSSSRGRIVREPGIAETWSRSRLIFVSPRSGVDPQKLDNYRIISENALGGRYPTPKPVMLFKQK